MEENKNKPVGRPRKDIDTTMLRVSKKTRKRLRAFALNEDMTIDEAINYLLDNLKAYKKEGC